MKSKLFTTLVDHDLRPCDSLKAYNDQTWKPVEIELIK